MLKNNQKEIILLEDLGMLYPTETSKDKRRYGLFKCYCGTEFKAQATSIKSGRTKSCGCFKKECSKTHGLRKHRLYLAWYHMLDRCNNIESDNYKYYGARGIKVCESWYDVKTFIDDMYPSYIEGLSIDRINNDLGYNKDNCRWTTKSVQTRNTRKLYAHNTTGYRGVGLHKASHKYRAIIKVNSNRIHLGLFITAIEAAKAYDEYVIDNNLEHTRNFI